MRGLRSRPLAWLAGCSARPASRAPQPAPGRRAAATDACVTRAVESIQRRYEAVRDLSADFVQTTRSVALGGGGRRRHLARLRRLREARQDALGLRGAGAEPGRERRATGCGSTTRRIRRSRSCAVGEGFLSGAAIQFLLGEGEIRRDFEVTAEACSDARVELVLVPRRDASYEKLRVRSDPATGELLETTVIDLLGNVTADRLQRHAHEPGSRRRAVPLRRACRRARDRARAPEANRTLSANPRRAPGLPKTGSGVPRNPGCRKVRRGPRIRRWRRWFADATVKIAATPTQDRIAGRQGMRNAKPPRHGRLRGLRVAARGAPRERAMPRPARRQPSARPPWIPRLAPRAAAPRCLTEGVRLIDSRNAESCGISRCSARFRPRPEVDGTSHRSSLVSVRRGTENQDDEPSHARCTRARVAPPGAVCDESARHAARLQGTGLAGSPGARGRVRNPRASGLSTRRSCTRPERDVEAWHGPCSSRSPRPWPPARVAGE